jgi:hypothetical protein
MDGDTSFIIVFRFSSEEVTNSVAVTEFVT